MSPNAAASQDTAAGVALRATLPGIAAALIGGAVVIASGRLPDGADLFVGVGCAIAAVTGSLGVRWKTRIIAPKTAARPSDGAMDADGPGTDPRAAAQQLQIALFGDFALQLGTIGVAMLGMYLAGVKFTSVAGFALAFAAVTLAHQLGSAFVMWRVLRRRAQRSPAIAGEPAAAVGRPNPTSPPSDPPRSNDSQDQDRDARPPGPTTGADHDISPSSIGVAPSARATGLHARQVLDR